MSDLRINGVSIQAKDVVELKPGQRPEQMVSRGDWVAVTVPGAQGEPTRQFLFAGDHLKFSGMGGGKPSVFRFVDAKGVEHPAYLARAQDMHNELNGPTEKVVKYGAIAGAATAGGYGMVVAAKVAGARGVLFKAMDAVQMSGPAFGMKLVTIPTAEKIAARSVKAGIWGFVAATVTAAAVGTWNWINRRSYSGIKSP